MCSIVGSIATLIVGSILVIGSCLIGYVFVPSIIENMIIKEVVLLDDTVQMERFEELPFPINFTVRIFNVTNPAEVLNGGVPVVSEIGPYVYRLYQSREILSMEEDTLRYKRRERFEFDPDASYPNTEDDMLTVINVPFHAVIQTAEKFYPNLLSLLNLAMDGVFGEINEPITTIRVRNLLFDGLSLCVNPGLIGQIACSIIREIAASAKNIQEEEDGSLTFSVLNYKEILPSEVYRVHRGRNNPADLGRIISYGNSPFFNNWPNKPTGEISVCNMINGTDAGIFAPFAYRTPTIYAINTDICRSVELRYVADTEYEGIPTLRFAANEWTLDNDDGCFCVNATTGLNRDDGCLLRGAMELYSCVGATLVMSFPHFLFADPIYQNGVVGMRPSEEKHQLFIDIEPNTGTPIRGFKRAQFNVFSRVVAGIPPTQNLRTSLVPLLWVEEGIALPEEYVDELTNRLLYNLRLVDILIPVLIAICCIVMLLGIILTIRVKSKKSK